ncbi:4Fe-4S binding protein [Rhodovulum adriaticum]|uniref:4Fe-4S binding protein n=1 Tax=Rhodovulum adriaticum TaxID=35804 RepID=A0A4R2NNH4_RHOAD|nr:4Fe-4S binding protein [Rhodovulum adriaticum]MBK1636346.1 ferredoxin [Rhodovulum adriaticum]TCP22835.1 4Fe-4S binding protein [Rhodovulum adriaticum]
MSFRIVESNCTACGACEFECPNAAISYTGGTFVIDPDKCTECAGQYENPQCAEVCPVPETCIPV